MGHVGYVEAGFIIAIACLAAILFVLVVAQLGRRVIQLEQCLIQHNIQPPLVEGNL